jgi:hypothetical protein
MRRRISFEKEKEKRVFNFFVPSHLASLKGNKKN